jgi:antirestriction protein ArdC
MHARNRAELGSAFLCADLGITPEVREDHAT